MFGENNQQSEKKKEKKIVFVQNGNPQKIFTHIFTKSFNLQDIAYLYQKNWGAKPKNIRLYSFQGVEIIQEQLGYIRNNDRIYLSKGQQFDGQKNFGEYTLVRQLGEGGFGKVWLGKSNITQQAAAIKILKIQKITGARDIDMIFRQVETLRALTHPNIVKIYNCYTLSNMQLVVIMQYLQGGELRKFLKQKSIFDQKTARNFFKQIIEAVSHCHRQGIIHRDLKLQNVLIASKNDFKIKVADFGISGLADTFNPDLDIGTLRYMAPQILNKKQKNNSSSVDIWACGIMLYLMIFGQLPFSQDSRSATISAIINGEYSFPSSISVSQEAKSLISWILQVNPKLRPTMSQIRNHKWTVGTFNNPPTKQIVYEPDVIKTESPKIIKKVTQLRKIFLPKRLQKQKQQVYQQLRIMRASRSRMLHSQVKYLSNNSPRYGKSTKVKEQQDALKRKQSIGCSKIWK